MKMVKVCGYVIANLKLWDHSLLISFLFILTASFCLFQHKNSVPPFHVPNHPSFLHPHSQLTIAHLTPFPIHSSSHWGWLSVPHTLLAGLPHRYTSFYVSLCVFPVILKYKFLLIPYSGLCLLPVPFLQHNDCVLLISVPQLLFLCQVYKCLNWWILGSISLFLQHTFPRWFHWFV